MEIRKGQLIYYYELKEKKTKSLIDDLIDLKSRNQYDVGEHFDNLIEISKGEYEIVRDTLSLLKDSVEPTKQTSSPITDEQKVRLREAQGFTERVFQSEQYKDIKIKTINETGNVENESATIDVDEIVKFLSDRIVLEETPQDSNDLLLNMFYKIPIKDMLDLLEKFCLKEGEKKPDEELNKESNEYVFKIDSKNLVGMFRQKPVNTGGPPIIATSEKDADEQFDRISRKWLNETASKDCVAICDLNSNEMQKRLYIEQYGWQMNMGGTYSISGIGSYDKRDAFIITEAINKANGNGGFACWTLPKRNK